MGDLGSSRAVSLWAVSQNVLEMINRFFFAYQCWYQRSRALPRSVLTGLILSIAVMGPLALIGPINRPRAIILGVSPLAAICLFFVVDPKRRKGHHQPPSDGGSEGNKGGDGEEKGTSELLDLLGEPGQGDPSGDGDDERKPS